MFILFLKHNNNHIQLVNINLIKFIILLNIQLKYNHYCTIYCTSRHAYSTLVIMYLVYTLELILF